MSWSAAAGTVLGRLGASLFRRDELSPERVATALYRGILGREPDLPGLAMKAEVLRSGDMLEQIIRTFIDSPEFRTRCVSSLAPPAALPNLTAAMPEHYEMQLAADGSPVHVYVAGHDSDMTTMAELIEKHRYYDSFGVWVPVIDLDKQITAAIVRGLGARSCFELGCFTGPVLSLLADAGISVLGSEVSHLAFAFAYPNIRSAMIYGDVLAMAIDRRFDVVLCMDVLEHINPLLLDRYIARLVDLMEPAGSLYLNAPMWGEDRVFGVFEKPYLAEWREVRDQSYWRHWPCDHNGWPIHGHLVWASPGWWEQKLAAHGLVRDIVVEGAIHRVLGRFFTQAIGRRTLFVLRRDGQSAAASEATAASVVRALAAVPGLDSL